MKRLLVFLVFLALVSCFTGCSRDKPTTSELVIGEVTILSGEQSYEPYTNWVHGKENDLYADGAYMQPEGIADELTAIPYSDDIRVEITGNNILGSSYNLYNSEYEVVYWNMGGLTIPDEEGEYILCVVVSWGTEDRYTGYQHFFKIIR